MGEKVKREKGEKEERELKEKEIKDIHIFTINVFFFYKKAFVHLQLALFLPDLDQPIYVCVHLSVER